MAAKAKDNVTEIPSYQSAHLGNTFKEMVLRRQKLAAQKKAAEKELGDSKNPALNAEIELMLAERDLRSVVCDKYQVTIADGSNTSLSKELLLEAGVDADILEACTVTKPYTYLVVTEVKENKARIAKLVHESILAQGPKGSKLGKRVKARVMKKAAAIRVVPPAKKAKRSA